MRTRNQPSDRALPALPSYVTARERGGGGGVGRPGYSARFSLAIAKVTFILLLVSMVIPPTPADFEGAPSIDDVRLRTNQVVEVQIRVRAGEQQLAIPFCQTDEGQREILCNLATTLEVKTRTGWHPAKTPPDSGLFGGAPLIRANVRLIPPHKSAIFTYEFTKGVFSITPGQQLRVMVDAWPDQKSVTTNVPGLRIASPMFAYP